MEDDLKRILELSGKKIDESVILNEWGETGLYDIDAYKSSDSIVIRMQFGNISIPYDGDWLFDLRNDVKDELQGASPEKIKAAQDIVWEMRYDFMGKYLDMGKNPLQEEIKKLAEVFNALVHSKAVQYSELLKEKQAEYTSEIKKQVQALINENGSDKTDNG